MNGRRKKPKKPRDRPGQQFIDYSSRGQQLRLLRDARFSRSFVGHDGRPVGGSVIKSVLRAIDDHAGQNGTCFASQETLASEACCGTETLRRALTVLRDQLCIVMEEEQLDDGKRLPKRRVHRSICWANVALLSESTTRQQQVESTTDQPHPPPCGTPSPTVRPPHPPLCEDPSPTVQILSSFRSAIDPPPPEAPADRAAAELVECGVEWPRAALEAARAIHSEEHIRAIIAYFREHSPTNGWGAGALVLRLKHSRFHSDVDRGWPAPALKAKVEQSRASSVQAQAQRIEAVADQQAAARAVEAERERLFGAELDAMTATQLQDLATALNDLRLKHYRRVGLNRQTRGWLLKVIEERQSIPI